MGRGATFTQRWSAERTSPPTQRSLHCGQLDHLLHQAGGGHVVEAEVVQPVDKELTTTSKLARMQEDQDNAVISSMAALLVQEEAGLGLAQTQAADSESEHRAASPADGQEEEMLQASHTRYFIVEPSAGSLTALEAAMSHTSGVWSFPTTTERKLMSAVSSRQVVLTIFSVASSGAFQGCGVFTGQPGVEGGRSGVRMEWLASQGVSFTNTQLTHIINKMDDGRRLQTARDGQELDQGAAISLLQAMGVNSVLGGQQGRGKRERYFR